MTVHNTDGALQAREMGLQRVELAREMAKEQIAAVCALEGIETEVFVHGAHCMCYSGQCAMSALIGGRSGNRGTCAQPCRLPYTLEGQDNRYPLSLKDMSLADHIPELTAMGISCLKLEGRMKRPEYVAVVTTIYAALLRENRRPTAAERRDLRQPFPAAALPMATSKANPTLPCSVYAEKNAGAKRAVRARPHRIRALRTPEHPGVHGALCAPGRSVPFDRPGWGRPLGRIHRSGPRRSPQQTSDPRGSARTFGKNGRYCV